MYLAVIIIVVTKVSAIITVELDLIDCGVDHESEVSEGEVELYQYPWLGILYYQYFGEVGETRAVTTVALIHIEFVIGPAADIGPMPKTNFRRHSRVLLGEGWNRKGRRVRNYVIHPEYEATYNTVALVQLRDPVRDNSIKPLCPPPQILKNPVFYVVKMKEDLDNLEKEVVNVMHIPGKMCKEFYVAANLYSKKMRPPHVACAVSLTTSKVCVWNAGAALVSRDVWGRWQLLGLGVRGPGCGAPSRYLDMMTYYPWIEHSLAQFQRITISKISKQKYVLRTSGENASYQKFGACDEEEKVNLIYRELIILRTDNNQYQFLTYNVRIGSRPRSEWSFLQSALDPYGHVSLRFVKGLSMEQCKLISKHHMRRTMSLEEVREMSIYENVEFSCLTLELKNASAVSEMKIDHHCFRKSYGPACYSYKGSVFEISVYLMFSDTCLFEMYAWGWPKQMDLLDIQKWKWVEGSYYEDFTMTRVEYRGQKYMTDFGFEPLDLGMWLPEYDIWATTEVQNATTASTEYDMLGVTVATTPYVPTTTRKPTTSTTTTPRTKKKPRRKTRTTSRPRTTTTTK